MIEPLSQKIVIVPAILPSAGVAASTLLNGAVLDLEAYHTDQVLFVVTFGVITAGAATSIKAQVDTVVAMDSAEDITGSSVTVADTGDDKTFYLDVINPPQRFFRGVVSRATQTAVVASAYYLLYGMRNRPVTHPSTVTGEIHRNKIVGTA